MTPRGVRWRAIGVGASAVGALLSLVALKQLGYSTSWIVGISEEEVSLAPSSGRLEVGKVQWGLGELSRAPSLTPFRTTFADCASTDGVLAAKCVFERLEHAPIGNPSSEFVDVKYDPAAALAAHLGGEPGHCTTRSALAATALLALGKPARLIQLYPAEGSGHNLIEVFDLSHGWVVFDPSTGDTFSDESGQLHSGASLQAARSVRWTRLTAGPDVWRYRFATVLYPEPWLYTRVGARAAPWPFRAIFLRGGTRRLDLGPLQRLAQIGALAFSGLASFLLFSALARLLPRRRGPARPTNGVPTVGPDSETPASAP